MEIEIRPLGEHDLAALESDLPHDDEAKYRKRLLEQSSGTIVYLIAWVNGRPVGHGFVRWKPEKPLASHHPGVPIIGDLGVKEELRSLGIGSEILKELERRTAEAGFDRAALAVDVSNARARTLYEREGYAEAGMPPTRASWSYVGRDGQFRTESGVLVHLIKELGRG